MRRSPFGAAVALALFLAVLLIAGAGLRVAHADESPLPADQAFQPSIQRSGPHMLVVSWRIADGTYLYRHALDFKLVDGGSARLGTPQIPPGHKHRDPYFGSVETYRHRLQVSIPMIGPQPPGARLQVTYQGCADVGLCYPPQHDTLTLPPPPSETAVAQAEPRTRHDTAAPADTGDRSADLAAALGRADLWYTMALFFVLGIGLAFTPCILPMIPIVAGMLGTRDHSRRRAAALTGAYVFAMALAYGLFGLIAGYFGANLQAWLQRPTILLPFAALFAILAAASFGWFELQIPAGVRSRLAALNIGGGLTGAAALGFLAALIAGPCLAPPLAGALLYISSSGNVLTGALALFCLGLGIGAPLIALAVFGVGVLPRSGPWMIEIRVFFGVLLAAIGLWLALRLAAPDIALAAWGALALAYGAYLSTRATISTTTTVLKRMAVAALFGYAALAGAGWSIGDGRPTAPLAGVASGNRTAATQASPFEQVTTPAQLSQALAAARRAGRPAVVDVYADWCVDCVRMQHTVFADPSVRQALSRVAAIQFDVTAYDPAQRERLQNLNVFGPPTLLFYSGGATADKPSRRLVGTVDKTSLIDAIHTIDG
ncbi:protein-disulfide reductase DsbD [Salinisphaera hydrothermalis]|uniref:protein-disulfide reductase DsbD n=1 Tax=Salinisphaera hydrothermalis TaxID=563188 RepID=UPI00334293A5